MRHEYRIKVDDTTTEQMTTHSTVVGIVTLLTDASKRLADRLTRYAAVKGWDDYKDLDEMVRSVTIADIIDFETETKTQNETINKTP